MKKQLVVLFVFASIFCQAQDLLNQYKDYTQYNPYPAFPINNSISGFTFTHYRSVNANYNGEYEIYLDALPNIWQNNFPNLAKSYNMEIVSFPFTMSCADIQTCDDGLAERELFMPDDPFTLNANIGNWGILHRELPSLGNLISNSSSQTLVSYAFTNDILNSTTQTILPHSVIKHTVNIHCGPFIFDRIVNSYSWYTDLTRGNMRWYPFRDLNINGAEPQYDIVYLPELVSNNANAYDVNFGANLTLPYNALNYFPSNQITNPSNCQLPGTTIPTAGSNFGNRVYPADYFYVSAPARSWDGQFLAGYQPTNPNFNFIDPNRGIKHEYYIDKGFPDLDLTWINYSEKVIYNPSEVSVISNGGALTNLVFPSLYTFKTILGVYPSVDEVNDANTVENGGPYIDPRDVPVPVNAFEYMPFGSQLSKYPHVSWDDPTTTDIDERFGYYYIENNGQITVEPCVKIFDAKFDVKRGGTLIFQDFTQTKNPARFAINSQEGVVARNYADIQYLQNSIVIQTQKIDYIAKHEIYAGDEVDLTSTIGPYSLESGSNVEMVAEDAIYLQDGFSAMLGSDFYAHCANTAINQPACALSWRVSNNSNSKDDLKIFVKELDIKIKPNPTANFTTISSDDVKIGSLELTDLTGRKLLQNDFNGNQVLNLESYESGIYIVSLTNSTGQNVQRKIVKQ